MNVLFHQIVIGMKQLVIIIFAWIILQKMNVLMLKVVHGIIMMNVQHLHNVLIIQLQILNHAII